MLWTFAIFSVFCHFFVDVELEEHQTNLTALSSICDEFRMHLNHWICIKQRVQNNRWLREILPSIMSEVAEICERFVQLQETAFWWAYRRLHVWSQNVICKKLLDCSNCISHIEVLASKKFRAFSSLSDFILATWVSLQNNFHLI